MLKMDSLGNELNEYGFRKDFNYKTRFHLTDEINGYYVSTVDLGLDHSFGIGEPLYYETMIFKTNGEAINFSELFCKRYSTEEEARKGHIKAVEYAKNDLKE